MTGCYRFVGRDCVADKSSLDAICIHCGCPISKRSKFGAQAIEELGSPPSDASRRVQELNARKRERDAGRNSIAEALAETRGER